MQVLKLKNRPINHIALCAVLLTLFAAIPIDAYAMKEGSSPSDSGKRKRDEDEDKDKGKGKEKEENPKQKGPEKKENIPGN